MRQTVYVPGYGYVTSDDSFEYVANGILGDAMNFIGNLVTSKEAKDIAVEAGKSFAGTAGKKAGDKLADKIFSKKASEVKGVVSKVDEVKDIVSKVESKAAKKKTSTDLLKEIYGNGIFKQSGKGLKRI